MSMAPSSLASASDVAPAATMVTEMCMCTGGIISGILGYVRYRPRCKVERGIEANELEHHTSRNLFERLGRPRHVVAPMVDQSELPFRMLTRRYGAQLCYTPMINAKEFLKSAAHRQKFLGETPPEDRPLIVQFAGHEPQILLRAARYVEGVCDAVDINLGCPQAIARRGLYGSFLLEEEDLVVEIVKTLSKHLSVPVTCKIRLFRGDLQRTLRLCQRLQDAGCAMLAVHGRNRHQNKHTVGECDWEAIAAVKAALRIPVIANGGIAVYEDLSACLDATSADSVMTSEAILENPALFSNNVDTDGKHVDQHRIADEYLDLVEKYFFGGLDDDKRSLPKICPKCVKAHLFKFLHAGLQSHHDLRDRVGQAQTLQEYRDVVLELKTRHWEQPMFGLRKFYNYKQSWYFRHRVVPAAAPRLESNANTQVSLCSYLDEHGSNSGDCDSRCTQGDLAQKASPQVGVPENDEDESECQWAVCLFNNVTS